VKLKGTTENQFKATENQAMSAEVQNQPLRQMFASKILPSTILKNL